MEHMRKTVYQILLSLKQGPSPSRLSPFYLVMTDKEAVKIKVSAVHAVTSYRSRRGTALLILNLRASWIFMFHFMP